jgi:hypothetical protein
VVVLPLTKGVRGVAEPVLLPLSDSTYTSLLARMAVSSSCCWQGRHAY